MTISPGNSPVAWPEARAWPAKVNIASVMAMSRWQPCPVRSRWRKPSRMLINAGKVPPPMSAISAGAGRVSTLRRIVPARAFDKQIRKLNQLAS